MIVHVLRKPLAPGLTVAANALAHGAGALNIDACRISASKPVQSSAGEGAPFGAGAYPLGEGRLNQNSGRWPANLILSHLPGCHQTGTKQVAASFKPIFFKTSIGGKGTYGGGKPRQARGYGDETGHENVAVWDCVEGCPVKIMDEQSGDRPGMPVQQHRNGGWGADPNAQGFGDTGGASRFFIQTNGGHSRK